MVEFFCADREVRVSTLRLTLAGLCRCCTAIRVAALAVAGGRLAVALRATLKMNDRSLVQPGDLPHSLPDFDRSFCRHPLSMRRGT